MHVDESSPLKVDRDGQTWFFCSEHCRDLFLGRTVSRPAPAAPAALYYCPMCPGEESNRPGTCRKCGMALQPSNPSAGDDDPSELAQMSRRLAIGAGLSVPVVALAMAHGVPGAERMVPEPVSHWIQFLFSVPVVLWAGAPLLQRGWRSFRTRQLNMFSLVSLGIAAAFLYSAAAVLVLLLNGLEGLQRRHRAQALRQELTAAARASAGAAVLPGQEALMVERALPVRDEALQAFRAALDSAGVEGRFTGIIDEAAALGVEISRLGLSSGTLALEGSAAGIQAIEALGERLRGQGWAIQSDSPGLTPEGRPRFILKGTASHEG